VSNWPTLLRWIRTEGFPQGILLGANTRAWLESDVLAWLESRRDRDRLRVQEQSDKVIARTAGNLSRELDRLERELPGDAGALGAVMRELATLQPRLALLLMEGKS